MEPHDNHVGFPGTKPGHLAPSPFSVQETEREADDVVTLSLEAEKGSAFSFSPGQFNMVYLFGAGEVPISIASDRAEGEPLKHTVRAAGKLTEKLVSLQPGETVGIRGPYGSNWPIEEARGNDVLIVAGGLGLAPLRTAMFEILDDRDLFGNVAFLYGATSPEQLLYEQDIVGWSQTEDVEVLVTVDRADRSWSGHVGVVTDLIPSASFRPAETTVFTCGPEIMMRFVIDRLRAFDVRPGQIHVSLERNMECAVSHCGHCQFGPEFICKDGPVLNYEEISSIFPVRNY